MRILFAGDKPRGVACLRALASAAHQIVAVLAHSGVNGPATVVGVGRELEVPVLQPVNPNEAEVLAYLRPLRPELTVLASYLPIVRGGFIELASYGCINLHGGKLPQYRGMSPMNWALINGEREFSLSIIQVNAGVDTGNVLAERSFPIGVDDTIADLQRIGDVAFPEMLLEVVAAIATGTVRGRQQDDRLASYYPRRFPDDGLILWDLYTAEQIHNRIRALTDPTQSAFTLYKGREVRLLASRLTDQRHYGEPGRVYRKSGSRLLVCASDRCLWIDRAVLSDSGEDAGPNIARYEKLATVRDLATEPALRAHRR